jgi:1-acyl-sn-glycerol-3-phosphate acyltransferase
MPFTPEQTVVPDPIFYEHVVRRIHGVLELAGELEVHGLENLPQDERTIFIAPHRQPFDPATIGTLLLEAGSPPVPFIGTSGIWNVPLAGSRADRMGTIPIERGRINSPALYEHTEHALTHGTQSLVVFPEGDLIHGPRIKNILPGVPILAALKGAVVCPIAIGGMDYLDFGNLTAVVGRPFKVDQLGIPLPVDMRSFVEGGRKTKDIREHMFEALQATLDAAEEIRATRSPMTKGQSAFSKAFKTVYGAFVKK